MIIDCISDKRSQKRNTIKKLLEIISSIKTNANGCKIWPMGINFCGYGHFSIKNRSYNVSRLLYYTLNPSTEKNLVIRHKCDVRSCCNIEHLEIGSQKDNVQDASKRRRLLFGESNPISKFTDEQVIKIREDYPLKSTVDLAKEYCTSSQTIRQMIIGNTWSHLPGRKKLLRNRKAIGTKAPTRKLTVQQVLKIREEYPIKTGPELAKEYGVFHGTIYCIVKRKTWTHI